MSESILIEFYPYDPVTDSIKTIGFGKGLTRNKVAGSDVPYNLRMASTFSHDVSVFENDLPSGSKTSIGTVVIHNQDGKYNFLFGYEWGARQVKIYRGWNAEQFSDYELIFDGSSMAISADRTTITFIVSERASLVPEILQTNTYTGVGGAGGYADLKGVPKPLCFGYCKNINPVLIDPVKQVWQVHDGTIEDIEGVYDGGVPLTKGEALADLTALVNDSNKPDNGSFRYTLSGYFRLGAPPAKFINADVHGEFYSQVNLPDTVREILLSRTSLTSGDLDGASFDDLATRYPGRCSGLYYRALDLGFVEWLENIISALDSFWYFNSLGKLIVKPFAFTTPVSIIRNDKLNKLTLDSSSRPLKEVSVLFDRNSEVVPLDEFTLVVEDLDLYVANKVIRVATDGSGNGGTYTYTDQIMAVMNGEVVSEIEAVTFYCAATWISINPDGTFTISDPGVATATADITANYAEFTARLSITLIKSMGASPFKNLTLASTDYIFEYDQNGYPVNPTESATITATKTNVSGTLVWSGLDNLGQSVVFTGSGDSRTLVASNVQNSPLVSYVDIRATAPDGTWNETRLILSRGSTGYFNQYQDILNQIDGKVAVFYQTSAPASGMNEGDLWFDTDDDKWYRRVGSSWVLTEDAGIGQAITAAASAQATADGKITTFYQSTAPTADGVGDLWVDTDEIPRKLRTWNGTTWEEVANVDRGRIVISSVAPTADFSQLGDIWQDSEAYYWYRIPDVELAVNNDGLMVNGVQLSMTWTLNSEQPVRIQIEESAAAIAVLAMDAKAVADGKIDSFYQTSMPSGGSEGDLWFDTDDGNKQYRRNATTWVPVQDAAIGNALDAAAAADAKADGKVTTFISETSPTAEGVGDLWFKASTGELRRWDGSAWGDPLVDLTSAAQVIVVPPATFTIYRNADGSVKADQLPVDLVPAVTRGGVDVRDENYVTYSVVGTGGLVSKVSVNNTNGSADKGTVTVDNTVTSAGTFQLTVSVSGIAVGTYVTQVVTVDDSPPVDNGTSGGTDSSLEAVTSTTYLVMTSQDSGDPTLDVDITSGQTLKLNTNFYYRNNAAGALTMTCKGQYYDGSTWQDMNSGTTEQTGSPAQKLSDPIEFELGSAVFAFTKTGLATGTYPVRLMGKITSGSGILTPTYGGATSSKS